MGEVVRWVSTVCACQAGGEKSGMKGVRAREGYVKTLQWWPLELTPAFKLLTWGSWIPPDLSGLTPFSGILSCNILAFLMFYERPSA